ncbi:Calmodulin-like protein 7 [Glycine soja]|nr:Calmodulin-like protein 7 [Glycine soja]
MDPMELKRVFQMFDRNGDGRISLKELSDSLENLGILIPDKDLAQMIERIDLNGDGCVDMDEFGDLYESIMEERDEEEDMREAFNVFDQNRDGFITVEELRRVLASLGLKQGGTLDECKKMITKVDVDGDGMVNYKEFRQMMKGGGFTALRVTDISINVKRELVEVKGVEDASILIVAIKHALKKKKNLKVDLIEPNSANANESIENVDAQHSEGVHEANDNEVDAQHSEGGHGDDDNEIHVEHSEGDHEARIDVGAQHSIGDGRIYGIVSSLFGWLKVLLFKLKF